MTSLNKKMVDAIIDQFWKLGYLTISRKFGTYLPEPPKVGGFEVDAIARQNNNYAIGLALSEDDFADPKLLQKLTFLASRQTKYTNKKVLLFIGTPQNKLKMAKELIEYLPYEAKTSIKIFPILNSSFNKKAQSNMIQNTLAFA
jgi:hypothetical protein